MSDDPAIGTRARTKTSVSFVVTRCGCSSPLSHAEAGLPCPTPQQVEDWGVVGLDDPNPLRRVAWRAGRFWTDTIKRMPYRAIETD